MIHCFLALFWISSSFAQNDINKETRAFSHAFDLYEKDLLLSAQTQFENYISEYPEGNKLIESTYFSAVCAVKLSQSNGEDLLTDFVVSNQHHRYASEAYLTLGEYFYRDEKYPKAVQYYRIAEENKAALTPENLFHFGHALFSTNDFNAARVILKRLLEANNETTKKAHYFLGYMAYAEDQWDEAKLHLNDAVGSKEYGNAAVKLIAAILYSSGAYQELVDFIDKHMNGSTDGDALKMQADAYFELEEYRLAALTYENLFKIHPKFRTHKSYYRAGVSYLEIDNLEKSIDRLKRAALSNDTLGAYASYELGVLYANANNLLFASSSFSNASKFDTELKNDAQYLHAKTEFDQKNFDNSISLFLKYSKDNGNSEYTELVNEMLSEAYLNTNNFDLAIDYIESLEALSEKTKLAYQRVTFLKGISLYNTSRYHESITFFQKSLTYSSENSLRGGAYYYIGEAYSRGKAYEDSKFYYEQAIESNIGDIQYKSIYGLAYAYFNLGSYQEAFDTFIKLETGHSPSLDVGIYSDGILRMGDCSFALKNYDSAIHYYDKALKQRGQPKAYIHYQKGLVYRYSENFNNALKSFRVVLKNFPNSEKADDALFQIVQISFESGDYKLTVSESGKLIGDFPDSKYLPFALLNSAVAQNNLGNQNLSVKSYTAILDRFPRHTVAKSAMLGLQELAGLGHFNDFDLYFEKYKKANPNSDALETIEFESARTLFFSQNYDAAINAFGQFKNAYPKSVLVTEAIYFIADSWYRKNNIDQALEGFYKISGSTDYSRHIRIIHRIAVLEAKKGNLEVSNNYFQKLRDSGGTVRDMNNARFGLLSNFFSLNNYDSVVYYGEVLMTSSRISDDMKYKTILMLGKAEYNSQNFDKASEWFLLLVENSPNEKGAEAKYFISKILFEKDEHDRSLASLFELKDDYRMFENWVGEAFLLMADNYLAIDEDFQAKATLNSLIDNIKIDTIRQRALIKLEQIESEKISVDKDTVSIKKKDE